MGKTLKGIFKSISVSEESIIISNNIGHGSTEIPLSEVTNFIFQKGSFTKNGFLTVCTFDGAGYSITVNTAAANKNSVMFQYAKNSEFELLHLELRGMVQLKSLGNLKPALVDSPDLKPTESIPAKDSSTALKFCSNCGAKLTGGKFCSECGAAIEQEQPRVKLISTVGQGHEIKVCLNCGERLLVNAAKCPACNVDAKEFPVMMSGDTEHIRQIKAEAPHVTYKKSFWQRAVEQGNEINAAKAAQPKPLSKRERIKENKANAVACCPKCGSTSLSANKKGFGIGKAVIGAGVTTLIPGAGIIGAVAGNAGAKKVIVTCMNCGHQWKA